MRGWPTPWPTPYVDGLYGQAGYFDGVDDYVSIADPDDFRFRNESFTISAWVQVADNESGYCKFVYGGDGQNALDGLFILEKCRSGYANGRLVTIIYGPPPAGWRIYGHQTGEQMPKNEWMHLAVVADCQASTLYLYVDAQQQSTFLGAFDLTNTVDFFVQLGAQLYPDNKVAGFHHGLLDDVAIWNRALTTEEIESLATPTTPVEIDIKPGSDPNSINLGSQGVIPVAILTTDDFDATTVDAGTVTLAGAGVAVRGKGNKSLSHNEDVDNDGDVDLLVQVETENLDEGQFQDGYAILTGSTFGGIDIEGRDTITIVPE